MRCKTRTIFAIGCAALLGMSAPAFSRPDNRNADQDLQARPARSAQPVPRARPVQQRAVSQPRRAARPVIRQEARPQVRETSPFSRFAHGAFRQSHGSSNLVAEARKYLGTNPTRRKRLWCATFMNFVLAKAGYSGTGSDAAKSFAYYGHRISEPKVGAIAVLTRGRRGGHVGVVTGIDQRGNPIIISGNSGARNSRRVTESVYSRGRVIAYVMPSDRRQMPAPGAAPSATQVAQTSERDGGIDSPIAELLAAIARERTSSQQPQPRTAAPAPPAVRHRVVEQVPPSAPQASGGRELPLDPALADFLGLADRDQGRAAPRRMQRTQAPAGRVATSESLSARLGLPR